MVSFNTSIEQCANCGHSLEPRDEMTAYRPIGDVYGSTIERMIGYCCSRCGYFEEV